MMKTLASASLAVAAASLALSACGTPADTGAGSGARLAQARSWSGPLASSPKAACDLIASVYKQGKPTWARAKAPLFPTKFWLTDNKRVKLGTRFEQQSFECFEDRIEMTHKAYVVYGTGGVLGLGEKILEREILQKDVFSLNADGTITDSLYFENAQGELEKSEFQIKIETLSPGLTTYSGTIPFPYPVCPLALGVKDFKACEIRLYHRAENIDGVLSGYDGWTLVALNKKGEVVRSQVTPATLSLSTDRRLAENPPAP